MARPKDPTLRERIVRAAAREFARLGVRGASVAHIGRQAGVTKGGVYFHFHSKEDLFLAVVDALRADLRGASGKPISGNAAAQLEGFLAAQLRFHMRQPEARVLVRMLGTELRAGFDTTLRGDARGELRSLRARLRELFSEGQVDGSLLAEDPALAAVVVAGAVEGILEQWRAAPRDVEAFGGAESLAAAIVTPYRTSGERVPPPPPSSDRDFQPPF
ncbi:MAG: TetR/AcrR family transcriptional regulator [Planctomycetota bacterium]